MIVNDFNISQHFLFDAIQIELELSPDEARILDEYCLQSEFTYDEVIQQLIQKHLDLQKSN
ncbi:hypothetical protein H6G91_37035 [Nostoc muscorum FACHB-395]|nr:hypothetical protein [Desmonostoc muscorum FACHB-395]